MADTENKPKLEVVQTPLDALDLNGLWLDPALGDGITETVRHSIPLGKPRDFFRTHPDKSFRRPIEIYRHRPEGVIEDEFFALWGDMKGTLEEAAPYSLVTCIYRDGTPRLWPVRMAKDGERDNEAWTSARAAARDGIDKWVKLLWVGRAFTIRVAQARLRTRSRLEQAAVVRGVAGQSLRAERHHSRYLAPGLSQPDRRQAEGDRGGRYLTCRIPKSGPKTPSFIPAAD